MNLILDKITIVHFICPTCKNKSVIKTDYRGEFPSYMQCYHCEQCIQVFGDKASNQIKIHIMSKEEVAWLFNIKKINEETATPLLIFKTKNYS